MKQYVNLKEAHKQMTIPVTMGDEMKWGLMSRPRMLTQVTQGSITSDPEDKGPTLPSAL